MPSHCQISKSRLVILPCCRRLVNVSRFSHWEVLTPCVGARLAARMMKKHARLDHNSVQQYNFKLILLSLIQIVSLNTSFNQSIAWPDYFPAGSHPSRSSDVAIPTHPQQICTSCEACFVMLANPKPVAGVSVMSSVTHQGRKHSVMARPWGTVLF